MFFELGSALARRPSARLKRLCPFTIFTNCFGSKVRDSGQSLVPEPPHRIIFVMFFLFLCEILRHYSKIRKILEKLAQKYGEQENRITKEQESLRKKLASTKKKRDIASSKFWKFYDKLWDTEQ